MILTGAGKSFCAGADLRWMQKIAGQKREDRIAEATELSEMLGELDQLNNAANWTDQWFIFWRRSGLDCLL